MRTARLVIPGTLLALIAAACGGDSSAQPSSGAQLFENNCKMCHAGDGSGSQLAPTLHGKKQYWTREKLLKYFLDPPGYARKDPRLEAQGKRYGQPMPTYKMLPQQHLEALADHVLAMP